MFVGPERPPEQLNAVEGNGEGAFVAVGDNGVVYWSPDGEQWVFLQVNGLQGNVMDVAFINGEWLLATASGEVGVSENGRVWEIQTWENLFGSFSEIVRFNDRTYLVGKGLFASSSDHQNWGIEAFDIDPVLDAFVMDGKLTVISFYRGVDGIGTLEARSYDGHNDWVLGGIQVPYNSVDDLSVAVGDGIVAVTVNGTRLYTSTDSVTWQELNNPTVRNANLEYAFELDGRVVMYAREYELSLIHI